MKSIEDVKESRREYYRLTNRLPHRPVQFSDIALFASMAESSWKRQNWQRKRATWLATMTGSAIS